MKLNLDSMRIDYDYFRKSVKKESNKYEKL